MIKYFCDKDSIEDNAISRVLSVEDIYDNICIFPDIHYSSENSLPVGVAFESTDIFNPLIIGKDIGCGVMFLRFSNKDWKKNFNKKEHYNALNKASLLFTDEGLGSGNHFLSIEIGNDNNTYIICHTGTRNLGIYLHQKFNKIVNDFNFDNNLIGSTIPISLYTEELHNEYIRVLNVGTSRRKEFVLKTLNFLISNSYVNSKVGYEIKDSIHNLFRVDGNKAFHRKGATELLGDEIVMPISMTRGSIIVIPKNGIDLSDNLYSCSHGAGRKLSRTDTLKYWHSLKNKDKKDFEIRFSELLERNGKFSNGLIQEFDFAYKESDSIMKDQPFLKEIARTNPIVTIKFSEK